jgi:DNA repair photolyase
MTSASSRAPDHTRPRFFLSPILGCSARCSFCYIFSFGYTGKHGLENRYGIERSLAEIVAHDEFAAGRHGSVLSIGAWGDPFPPPEELRATSLRWLAETCKLGNPVQIMSRFELDDTIVDRVVESQVYDGQLMFSTSLSSLANWKLLERGSSSPQERLRTLGRFASRGIPTNLMIKPFLPGVTDQEGSAIAALMSSEGVMTCVVGDLYLNEQITRSIDRVATIGGIPVDVSDAVVTMGHELDCAPEAELKSVHARSMQVFIDELWNGGVAAFRKSACASSYTTQERLNLLAIPGFERYCVRCGMCDEAEPREKVNS